jgi:hypothetical protein
MPLVWRLAAAALLLIGFGQQALAQSTTFLRTIQRDAAAYQEELAGRQWTDAATPPDLLRRYKAALEAGDAKAAIPSLEQLVSPPDAPASAWLELSRAWTLASPHAPKALAAAMNAYLQASDDGARIDALLRFVEILQGRWNDYRRSFAAANQRIARIDALFLRRDTIPASHRSGLNLEADLAINTAAREEATAESLTAANEIYRLSEQLNQVFEEIQRLSREEIPPHLLAEAREPTEFTLVAGTAPGDGYVSTRIDNGRVVACLEFTLPLDPEVDYARRLTITDVTDGSEPVEVDAELTEVDGTELCVIGLPPGRTYDIAPEPELPSYAPDVYLSDRALAELALRTAQRTFAARFEAPRVPGTVGFRSRAYLLPSGGQGLVPLYTMNVRKVQLELVRVVDRALHRNIALDHIGNTISTAEFETLRGSFSERLWTGEVTLPDRGDVWITSPLPMFDLIAARDRSGVIAEARASGREAERVMEMRAGEALLRGQFLADPAVVATAEPAIYALLAHDIDGAVVRDIDAAEDDDADACGSGCSRVHVQWFAPTRNGVTLYETDTKLHAVVRDLGTGAAVQGASVELVATNDRVLARGSTNDLGIVSFDAAIARGREGNALKAVFATAGSDLSFLLYDSGVDALDLSHLGIDGKEQRSDLGLDALLIVDRGIARPGETIHVTTLLRNLEGRVPSVPPQLALQLTLEGRPVGEAVVIAGSDFELGGALRSMTVPRTAALGTYDLKATVSNGREDVEIASAVLQVSRYRPDRARLDFGEPTSWTARSEGEAVILSGRLFAQELFVSRAAVGGAGGIAGARADAEIRLTEAPSPVDGCYADYGFAPFDAPVSPNLQRAFLGYTDGNGTLEFAVSGGLRAPEAQHPLAASFSVTLSDDAGAMAQNRITRPLAAERDWIGLAGSPRIRAVPGIEGAQNTFAVSVDLVAFDRNNAPLPSRNVSWTLLREVNILDREHDGTGWVYRSRPTREPVGPERTFTVRQEENRTSGQPCLSPTARNSIELADLPLGGRYVLEIAYEDTGSGTPVERRASIRFAAGAETADAGRRQPTAATVTSDRAVYGEDDSLALNVAAPFDGSVLVALADRDVRFWTSAETVGRSAAVRVEDLAATLPADRAARGLYAIATVFRRNPDGIAADGPNRAIGATHVLVAGREGKSQLRIEAPSRIDPGEVLEAEICLADADGCRDDVSGDGFAVVYAVDEGLINLTSHPVPDPGEHFFGPLASPIRISDNYSRIMFSEGGDRPSWLQLTNYTSDVIVSEARYIRLRNGRARLSFADLRLAAGTLRLVGVAWTADHVAGGTTDVQVRPPVIAELALPPFVTPGDAPAVALHLTNRSLPEDGPARITVRTDRGVTLTGVTGENGDELPLDRSGDGPSFTLSLPLLETQRPRLNFAVAGGVAGDRTTIALAIEVGGADVRPPPREVPIRPALPATYAAFVQTVEGGGSVDVRQEILHRLGRDAVPPDLAAQLYVSTHSPTLFGAGGDDDGGGTQRFEDIVGAGFLALQDAAAGADRAETVSAIIGEVDGMLDEFDGRFAPLLVADASGNAVLGNLQKIAFDGREIQEDDVADLYRTALGLDLLNAARTAGHAVSDTRFRRARRNLRDQIEALPYTVRCAPEFLYAFTVLLQLPSETLDRDELEDLWDCVGEARNPETLIAVAAVGAQFGDEEILAAAFRALTQLASTGDLVLNESSLARSNYLLSLAHVEDLSGGRELILALRQRHLGPTLRRISTEERAWLGRTTLEQGPIFVEGEAPDVLLRPAVVVQQLETVGSSVRTPFLALGREARGIAAGRTVPVGDGEPLTVRNESNDPLVLTVVLHGSDLMPTPVPEETGLSIEQRLYDAEGRELGPDHTLRLGDVISVVLVGRLDSIGFVGDENKDGADGPLRIAVADLLPAAFSIVDAGAASGAAPTAEPAATPSANVDAVVAGDDRVTAIVDLKGDTALGFEFGYTARVVSVGTFVDPPILVQPMFGVAETFATAPSTITVLPPLPAP